MNALQTTQQALQPDYIRSLPAPLQKIASRGVDLISMGAKYCTYIALLLMLMFPDVIVRAAFYPLKAMPLVGNRVWDRMSSQARVEFINIFGFDLFQVPAPAAAGAGSPGVAVQQPASTGTWGPLIIVALV